jgi:hypothetical protein
VRKIRLVKPGKPGSDSLPRKKEVQPGFILGHGFYPWYGMRSFWTDPYLWIHLAGFAALPLWLELCWLGLAVGDPVLPFWLELLLVAAIGIAPIFWMQWQHPFYIFSLIAVALKPAQLTEDQRRLLTLFKTQRNRFLAIAGAIIAFLALRQLYYLAPIASPVTPFASDSRWLGLLVAAISFLGANLFLQVPISVVSALLTSESTFAATTPYPLEQIRSDFTLLGIPVNQILPAVIAAPTPQPVAATANVGLTTAQIPEVPPATFTPEATDAVPASRVETAAGDAEDWFTESVSPTIPASELERSTDSAGTEPITKEVDLPSDLWHAAAASPAEVPLEVGNSAPVELEAATADLEVTSQGVEVLDSESTIDAATVSPIELVNPLDDQFADAVADSAPATPHEGIPGVGELVNPADIFNAEPIAEPQTLTIPEPNVTELINPLESDDSDAIADSVASTTPAEIIEAEEMANFSSPDPDSLPSTHHPPEDHTE